MNKVYMEIICDNDVADELLSYPENRVDVIIYDKHPDVIIEMGGEKYRRDGECKLVRSVKEATDEELEEIVKGE